jgi:hypothetical protein
MCCFLSLFAMDAFGGGKSFVAAVPDFALHITPILILLVIVALSWRWEWIGGIVFVGLGLGYAYMARFHVSWIATISGPLFVVGGLFLWSWARQRNLRVSR